MNVNKKFQYSYYFLKFNAYIITYLLLKSGTFINNMLILWFKLYFFHIISHILKFKILKLIIKYEIYYLLYTIYELVLGDKIFLLKNQKRV